MAALASGRRLATADGSSRPVSPSTRRLGPVRGAGDEPLSRSARYSSAAGAVASGLGFPSNTPCGSPENDVVAVHGRGAMRSQPSKWGRMGRSDSSAHCPIAAIDWRGATAAVGSSAASPRSPPTSGSFMDPADVRQSGLYKDKSDFPSTTLHEGLSPDSQPRRRSLNSEVEYNQRSSSPMAPKLLERQPSPQQQKQQQQPPQARLSQQPSNLKPRRTQSEDIDDKTSPKDTQRTSPAAASSRGLGSGASAGAAATAAAAAAGAVGGGDGAAATSAAMRNGSPQPLSRPGSARERPIRTEVKGQRRASPFQSPSTPEHIVHPSVSFLSLSLSHASQAAPMPSAQVVPPMAALSVSPPQASSSPMDSPRAAKAPSAQLARKDTTEATSFSPSPASQAGLESPPQPLRPSGPGPSAPPATLSVASVLSHPVPVPPPRSSSTSSSPSSSSSLSLPSSSSNSRSTSPATSATLPPVPSHFPLPTASSLPASSSGRKARGPLASASSLGSSASDAVLHATTSASPLHAMSASSSSLGEHKNGDDGASTEVTSESIEYYKQNSQCINWQDVQELCASMDIAGVRIEDIYIQCLPHANKYADGEDFPANGTQLGSALASAAARKLQPEEVLMAIKFQNMTLMHYPGDHNTKQRFHEVYINQ